jgi:amino acid transporter
MKKKISVFSLVLLIVAAIDSIRNLPATALFGSPLIFFFLLSAVLFLFPISLISAELSSRFAVQGGVFHWVRHAFGPKVALLAIWLQWINTMVWYPTILSFIAGTAAYLYDPLLAENRVFLISVILIVFWGLTFVNMRGIHVSVRFNSICGMMGTLLPMGCMIVLGLLWVFKGNPLQISFASSAWLPSIKGSENFVSLIAIMASFLGMELAGVHVADIENPQRNFPKAMGFSVLILLATMIFGSLSIAMILPAQEIHLVDGIMQTFSRFLHAFEVPFLIPVLTLLIIIGSVGQMVNWLISPAKGLLQAAEYGFLPSFFLVKNKHQVATRLLLAQAWFVTFFCLAFILMPSVNGFYWFLTDLSTGLYMLMYILVFLSALRLKRAPKEELGVFHVPKGLRTVACALGLVGCIVTIVVGYFPPEGLDVGSGLDYAGLIAAGNLLSIAPVLVLLWQKRVEGDR